MTGWNLGRTSPLWDPQRRHYTWEGGGGKPSTPPPFAQSRAKRQADGVSVVEQAHQYARTRATLCRKETSEHPSVRYERSLPVGCVSSRKKIETTTHGRGARGARTSSKIQTKQGLRVPNPNSRGHVTKRGLRVPNPNSRGHATKRGLRVAHPCLLGGPKEGGNATSPLHSRGSPTKGTKSEVKTYARGHNDAPSISKCGSLVQPNAQIATLR